MTHSFLLEVGLEDMPAQVVPQAERQLVTGVKDFLKEANISFGEVNGYSTPRRFAVLVKDLAEKQPDENITVRGPAQRIGQDEEGEWTKAAIGFSKGQGGSVDDLIIKDEDGEPYLYMEKYIPGKATKDVLSGLPTVIENIEFPKNMKWGTTDYQYIRPIHWIVALLDIDVVPFEVFGVKTGQETNGHRFLGETVRLNQPEAYEEALQDEYVIPNRSKRRTMIMEQLEKLCQENQWETPTSYTELLEEVTDLVEYPTVFYGAFDERYLDVPEMVLETSMIDHQRYFPVREAEKEQALLPYFISVRNGNAEHLDNVSRGNEKVLSARLADAKFFYEEDRDKEIADFVEQLKDLTYHDQLGSVFEKQERAQQMVTVIDTYYQLSEKEKEQLEQATSLYKFDLVTQVVSEFPSLQGKIGELYAKERQEKAGVTKAIGEQYLPTSMSDSLPETKIGNYLALIDKLDTLIQFFSVGLIPTGSNDPYALRRQALGVVRIMLALDEDTLALGDLLEDLVQASELPVSRQENLAENMQALQAFISDRVEQIMQTEYSIPHDVRQAALGTRHQNVTWMLAVAQVLEAEKNKEPFKAVVEALTRVVNMTEEEEVANAVNPDLLETESEKTLAQEVQALAQTFNEHPNAATAYQALEEIEEPVTDFFENNMVMIDNPAVKANRLTLLNKLAIIAKQFADFSQLVI